MATPVPHEISHLLLAWSDEDKTTLDRLVPLVYEELLCLAKRYQVTFDEVMIVTPEQNADLLAWMKYWTGSRLSARGKVVWSSCATSVD